MPGDDHGEGRMAEGTCSGTRGDGGERAAEREHADHENRQHQEEE